MSLQNHGNGNFVLRVLFSSVNVIQVFGSMYLTEFQFRRKQKCSSRDAILKEARFDENYKTRKY
jgi:hypothetical protein